MLQVSERSQVPRLLLIHLVITGVDFAMSVLGVVLGVQSDLFRRVSCMAGDRARNAVLVVVLGNWVVLLCTFLVVQSVFNMFSGVEAEESWRQRLAFLGGLLRVFGVAGLVGSDTDPMSDAARAFARIFRHIDFVASDFATALVMVGISHAEEARRREEAEWAALHQQAAGGGGGPGQAPLGGGPHAAAPASQLGMPPPDPGRPEGFQGLNIAASVSSVGEEGSDAGEGSESGGVSVTSSDARFGALPPTPVPTSTSMLGRFAGMGGGGMTQPLLGPSSQGGPRSPAGKPGAGKPPMLRPGSLAARQLARGRDPQLAAVVSTATHFSNFALAPYGWPLYVWANPRCGVCDLCCGCGMRHPGRRRQACWRRCYPLGGPHGPVDAADVAALVRFANLDEDDILHMSFQNSVLGALPYFIARDSRTHSIVLSVRGTLSVADCITDLLYEPAGLDGTVLGSSTGIPPGSCAHSGVLGCARALHADLCRNRVLHDAMDAAGGGWNLVLVGHSLGAGVATLIGLMLRPEYPNLKVWAFSPPGGLLSEALAEASGSWCTSVILGNDFICRLSMPNLERLRDEMMSCASRAKLPKFAILRRAAVAGPQLRAGEVMYSSNNYGGLGSEVEEALRRYSASVASARSSTPGSPSSPGGSPGATLPVAQLYPPGRLLHLVRLGRRRSAGSTVYLPRWTTREQLMSRIVVARNMFTCHFPDKMARELRLTAEAIGVPPVEAAAAAAARGTA